MNSVKIKPSPIVVSSSLVSRQASQLFRPRLFHTQIDKIKKERCRKMKNVNDELWFDLSGIVKQTLLEREVRHVVYRTVYDETGFPFVDRYMILDRINKELKGDR